MKLKYLNNDQLSINNGQVFNEAPLLIAYC